MDEGNPADVKVRLCMAEQPGDLAAAVTAALGSSLHLDTRIFHSSLRGRVRLLCAIGNA